MPVSMVAIKNRKKIGAIKANSIAAEPDTERNAEKCEAVFRKIAREKYMSDNTLISRARTVAFQGEPGAYANLAAKEALPEAAFIGKPTFEAALEAVRTGETDLAFVPVENSVYGRIADVHLLVRHFGRPVKGFIPEGEKDVHTLESWALTASCNSLPNRATASWSNVCAATMRSIRMNRDPFTSSATPGSCFCIATSW